MNCSKLSFIFSEEFSLPNNTKIFSSKLSQQNKRRFITGDDHNRISLWNFDLDTPEYVNFLIFSEKEINFKTISHQQSSYSINIEITSLIYDFFENSLFSGSNRGSINIHDFGSQKRITQKKRSF